MKYSLLSACALLAASTSLTASAWTTSVPFSKSIVTTSSRGYQRTTQLYNVPPPSIDDVTAFKEYADKQAPPASFFELQQDCVQATQMALRDGHKLLEIEFPPLPANVLEMDDVSAYEISYANLNLALDFAKGLMAATADSKNDGNQKSYKKFAILFPDEAEAEISVEKMLGGSKNPYPGIQVSSLRQSEEGDDRIIKVRLLLSFSSSVVVFCCAHHPLPFIQPNMYV